MTIYIYLLMQDLAIRCIESLGCTQLSNSHFTALLAGGLIEMIFEIPFAIRIFKSKEDREK